MSQETENTTPHRVTFCSSSVNPSGTPLFHYVAHAIEFDRLVFVAIVEAAGPQAASDAVKGHWEDATVRRVERGTSTLPHTNIGEVFGSSDVLPPSILRRIGRSMPVISLFVD